MTGPQLQINAQGQVQGAVRPPPARVSLDRVLFAEDLAELLAAGLTVREALEVMAAGTDQAAARSCLDSVARAVLRGSALSDAMEIQAQHFGPVLVALVRAGERSSGLAEGLARYARTQRRLDGLRSKASTALVYPLLLLAVGVAVLGFLLGWVLPGFSDVLRGNSEALSPLARSILQLGMALGSTRIYWLSALLLGILAVGTAMVTASGRAWLLAGVAALPGLRTTLRLLHSSRFFSTVATLTQGGMPAVAALELAQAMLLPEGQRHLRDALVRLREGQSLAATLPAAVFGDPVVGRLLEVGQRTGELPRTLERISGLLEARTTRRVERMTRALEPVLMVVLGLMVGSVVLLMYVPLIELSAGMP